MSDLIAVAIITAVPSTIAALSGVYAAITSHGTRREMEVVKTQTNHLTEIAVEQAGKKGRAEGIAVERAAGAERAAETAVASAAIMADHSAQEQAAAEKRTPERD